MTEAIKEIGIDAIVARGLSLPQQQFSTDICAAWKIIDYIETRASSIKYDYYKELVQIVNKGLRNPDDDHFSLFRFLFSSQGTTRHEGGPPIRETRTPDTAYVITLAAYNLIEKLDAQGDGPAEKILSSQPHINLWDRLRPAKRTGNNSGV